MSVNRRDIVAHSTSVCDALACIGDQLGAVAMNRIGAGLVTFHGSFSPRDMGRITFDHIFGNVDQKGGI